MGLFGKKKSSQKDSNEGYGHEKLPSSSEMHDPILKAVQEEQPFQQANDHHGASMTPSGRLRDIYGNIVDNADLSNPARQREERPLDTIRSFEFQTTGDERLKDTYETGNLGFRPRDNFSSMPHYESNPYANDQGIISFGDPNVAIEEDRKKEIYFPPPPPPGSGTKKKKKGGAFWKKKKKGAEEEDD